MDPMISAGAFATIIGLVCNYKSEHSGTDLRDFLAWLKEKRHEDIANTIQNNNALYEQLSSIITINHQQLLKRLEALDKLLSSVAGHIQEFSGLVSTLYPQIDISDQSVSILKQLVNSGAKLFMEHTAMSAPNEYILLEGGKGAIAYTEPQFIEDDLNSLVELGFLRLDFGSKGSRRFYVTRKASNFVREIDR